jgi:thymidylate synthase
MHLVSGSTVSDVVLQAFNKIILDGHYRPSRNGGCTSIFDVTFEVTNPRSRHLSLLGRKSNIFALIAETLWVMAGQDQLFPYLTFFLPRAPQYSDDGGDTWSGAYGPRLYDYNHLSSIPDLFRRDTLYTRRAFVPIHDPAKDSTFALEQRFGVGELGKDRPCNLGINFYVEGDDQFITKVFQRSGDIIFGTGSINPFEFSFLHELMYNEIKKDYPELKLGPYRWHVTNAHLYDFSRGQADEAIKAGENYCTCLEENTMPLIGPEVWKWRAFFRDLVGQMAEAIDTDDPEYVCGTLISHLGHTFIEYEVPVKDNLLWKYTVLLSRYISAKRGVEHESAVNLEGVPMEVLRPIINSSFRKFPIYYLPEL